jgi:hypothetical protein
MGADDVVIASRGWVWSRGPRAGSVPRTTKKFLDGKEKLALRRSAKTNVGDAARGDASRGNA